MESRINEANLDVIICGAPIVLVYLKRRVPCVKGSRFF